MIKTIQINNFRSYSKLFVELGPNINVFIGKNGQGKTNLLESIYFISNIRSHRTRNDIDLIKKNEDIARVIIYYQSQNIDKIMAVIHPKGKYFSLNDHTLQKTSELFGRINTVLFYPTETRLFTDSPSVRRTFFDVEIGKVSHQYTRYYQEFNTLLKDRNKLLKQSNVDLILLDIITKKMVSVQLLILQERMELTEFINNTIMKYVSKLSNDNLNISVEYVSSLKNLSESEIIEKYKRNESKDIFNKVTSEGVHRDDYVVYSNSLEVEKFLSQGQIRIVLLAIKLVLVDYIIFKTNTYPILLLDDVLSELDLNNQKRLLESIPEDIQTIITTTDDFSIFEDHKIKKFYIENSIVVLEEDLNV